MSFICRNFNNKTIRFIITDLSNGREKALNISGARHWSLILACTPIYESIRPDCQFKMYKTISDNNDKRFCMNIIGHSEDEIINVPAIYNSYNRYHVEVIDMHMMQLNLSSTTILKTCFDWAKNPSNIYNEHVLGVIADHEYHTPFYDGCHADISSTFIIQNMKQTRPIRFRMLDQTFNTVDSSRILAGFQHFIKFLITPID